MTDSLWIIYSIDGLIVLGAVAVSRGWVRGSLNLKLVPPWERCAPEPKVPKTVPGPTAEGSAVARLPERGGGMSVTEATG